METRKIPASMKPQGNPGRSARILRILRILLLLIFPVQAGALYLARTEIPLPKSICDRIAENLAPAGTRLKIGSAALQRLSLLKLNDVVLANESGTETLASARFVGARFFNWKNFPSLAEIAPELFFDGIELRCPASRAQTGKSEIVLDRGSIDVRLVPGEIRILGACARVAGIPVSAAGTLRAASETSEAECAPATAYSAFYAYTEMLSEIARRRADFCEFENLALHIDFAPAENADAVDVSAELFCDNLRCVSRRITVEKIRASAAARIFPETQKIVAETPLRISAGTLRARAGEGLLDAWNFSAEQIRAEASFPNSALELPHEVRASAGKIVAENFLQGAFAFAGTDFRARSADWKTAGTLDVFTEVFGSEISAKAAFDAVAGTQVSAAILPDLPQLFRVPQIAKIVPDDVKSATFFEHPRIHAEIALAPDFSFRGADWDLRAGPATWRTVRARGIRCTGTVSPAALDVVRAQVHGENFCANARVFVEFGGEKKYRVSTFGTLANPEIFDDYLGWFWWRIWHNLKLAPAEKTPRADIDVYGRWDDSLPWEFVYGSIAGENAFGGGVLVNKARLRVVEEPAFIAAFDMNFERGNDRASGVLLWNYAFEPSYHYRDFRFAFSGSFPPHDVFKIVGEGLPEAFDGVLEREASGTAVVRGLISGDEKFSPERIFVEIDVLDAPGAVKFLSIEGSDFRGKIVYDTGEVVVSPFTAKIGDGDVSGTVRVRFPEGKIRADGTRVDLNLNLEKVETPRLVSALKGLLPETATAPKKDSTPAPKDSGKKTAAFGGENSEFDARFSGSLTLPKIDSLTAEGKFTLRDPALYDLQIFGAFSRFLQMVKIPFTSFAFTTAEGNFEISAGKIRLPNLRVFGESGLIRADLEYAIDGGKIAGLAEFKNQRLTNIPVLGMFVDWASETTTLVPVELSGTLDDIQWSLRPFGNLFKRDSVPAEK